MPGVRRRVDLHVAADQQARQGQGHERSMRDSQAEACGLAGAVQAALVEMKRRGEDARSGQDNQRANKEFAGWKH